MVQRLLTAGAQDNAQDNKLATPLQTTAIFGFEQVAKLLIEAGADPSIQNDSTHIFL